MFSRQDLRSFYDQHHVTFRSVACTQRAQTTDHTLAMIMTDLNTKLIEMLLQGSSWHACLAIIASNSFDRKGKQESPSLTPKSPKDPSTLLDSVLFHYGSYVYFTPNDILSAIQAEQNLESWLIARFTDNCFINSSCVLIVPAQAHGSQPEQSLRVVFKRGGNGTTCFTAPLIPWVSAAFSFFLSPSQTQYVKGIPYFQASGNLQRSIIPKAGGGAQEWTRFKYSPSLLTG